MVEKTRALLATSRLPNVPSVVSNVWLGLLIAGSAGGMVLPHKALAVTLAGVCLYVAGNFFNDWYDQGWDKKHRPERALPSGLFKPELYRLIAISLAALGVLLAFVGGAGLAAIALMVLIAVYTRFHKQTKWAVIAMGACRAMLLLLGACSVSQIGNVPWLAMAMLALFCYIAGISLSARYETMPVPHAGAMLSARGLLIGAGALNAWLAGFHYSALPYFIWLGMALTLFRRPLSRQVSALLAGIPLLDWIVTLPLVWPGDCWAGGGWIAPLAFISALLLQRLAPAT